MSKVTGRNPFASINQKRAQHEEKPTKDENEPIIEEKDELFPPQQEKEIDNKVDTLSSDIVQEVVTKPEKRSKQKKSTKFLSFEHPISEARNIENFLFDQFGSYGLNKPISKKGTTRSLIRAIDSIFDDTLCEMIRSKIEYDTNNEEAVLIIEECIRERLRKLQEIEKVIKSHQKA